MRDITCKRWWLNWKSFLVALPILNLATEAFAQTTPRPDVPPVWWIAPIGALIALGFAYHFYRAVMKQDEGTENNARHSTICPRRRDGIYPATIQSGRYCLCCAVSDLHLYGVRP